MKKFLTKILLAPVIMLSVFACTGVTNGVLIHGVASEDANRNYPTAVKIFALGSDHLFYSYDFFTLTLEPESVLGVTLRKVLDEVEIAPGEETVFGPYELPANTRNIGVIGTFQAGENAQWRDTAEVIPNSTSGVNQEVYVVLRGNQISAMTKSEYEAAKREALKLAAEKAEEEAAAKKAAEEAAEEAEEAQKKAAEEATQAAAEDTEEDAEEAAA